MCLFICEHVQNGLQDHLYLTLQLALIYRELKKQEEMFETLTHVAQLSDSLAVSRNRSGSFILGSLRRFRRHFSRRYSSTHKHDDKGRSSSQSSALDGPGVFQHNSVGHRSRSPFIQRRDRTDALTKPRSSSVELLDEAKKLETPSNVISATRVNCKKGWIGEEREVRMLQQSMMMCNILFL